VKVFLATHNSRALRPQSALTCIEMADHVQKSFHETSVPFLCMIADEDVVVDNSISGLLMTKSPSQDKTMKSYAALHGLLCEPVPLLNIIENDLADWLLSRCP
jgi:esterase/lipase